MTEITIEDLLKKKYSLLNMWKNTSEKVKDVFGIIEMLPEEFFWLIKNLRKGKLSFNLQHKGLEKMVLEIDRASNQISFSIVIAALIIGSSLILQLNKPPFILGYSILGFIGYSIAKERPKWY